MKQIVVGLGLVSWLVAGCGPQSHMMDEVDGGGAPPPPASIPPTGSEVTRVVGPEGATLELEDFVLDIPAGAVASETSITVTVTSEAPPSGFTAFSPTFHFEPAGTTFEAPVTVRLPFEGDAATATIFWTAAGGTSYVPLRTEVDGSVALAEATHFSEAFVGTACSDGDCCGRANGDLDILLLVDNSNSMTEEQASLTAQIPRMARILATGDLDLDGTQDFPGLSSVRIGTVSSDMGTGGYTVPTCSRSDFGDDGLLTERGRTDVTGCAATYPPFAELRADDADPAAVEGFVEQVSCTALLGTGGCGFEQQLEAVLKAVTPSTSSTRFFNDTTGHGDGENAGFLRRDSVFATILLTDENDCSASDPQLFDPTSSLYPSEDLNLRCWEYADAALHPVSRYVQGISALRADPDDVLFAVIAGVPADLVAAAGPTDYDAILADSRMAEVEDPANPSRLAPSCQLTVRGEAFPPRRLVEAAAGFGDRGVVQSICQDDFTPVVDAILTRVAARVSGSCGAP